MPANMMQEEIRRCAAPRSGSPLPDPVLFLCLLGLLTGCGINTIPTLEEAVNASWAQVQNQYQRRADLIPNLVETVKGYAKQEQEVLTAVTEARAKVARCSYRRTS